jgi:transcriptional regulator with XRE-family HTH domain
MDQSISTRNNISQPQIFPLEMSLRVNGLVKCGMAKPAKPTPREIFLGQWLDSFEISRSEAARIAGCTQGYISNIARGARENVNALYLLRLSEHMHVTVNDFYRKPPSVSQLAPLADLSPAARQAILSRKQRKA